MYWQQGGLVGRCLASGWLLAWRFLGVVIDDELRMGPEVRLHAASLVRLIHRLVLDQLRQVWLHSEVAGSVYTEVEFGTHVLSRLVSEVRMTNAVGQEPVEALRKVKPAVSRGYLGIYPELSVPMIMPLRETQVIIMPRNLRCFVLLSSGHAIDALCSRCNADTLHMFLRWGIGVLARRQSEATDHDAR